MFAVAPLFCYALKANANLAIIRLLAEAGAGADTVSAGEVKRALAAGVSPDRIVFAGVAKGDDEIAMALDAGILQFNIESSQELERIAAIANARHAWHHQYVSMPAPRSCSRRHSAYP